MAVLSDAQPELTYDMTITRPGLYVVVIIYATTKDRPKSTIEIDGSTQLFSNRGTAAINNCRYSTLCRAVAVDRDNKVAIFNLDSNNAKFILKVWATDFHKICMCLYSYILVKKYMTRVFLGSG